ncbi:MAG: hypothetical protein PVF58_02485 [Candidatus Methanofastidiosia archaeon]|jgi:hypothetical protein
MVELTIRTFQKKVLEYTKEKKFFTSVEDLNMHIKSKYILELGIHGLISKQEPVNPNEIIEQGMEMFLNWYFFEYEKNNRSIAEQYITSPKFKKDFPDVTPEAASRTVKKLKHPVWGNFTVVKKRDQHEYDVKALEGESIYTIHDKSTYSHIEKGHVVFAKLYSFDKRYYLSGFLLKYPEETIKKFKKARKVTNQLNALFEEFMAQKDVKKKTAQKYEEMYFFLGEYVSHKGYTSMKRVTRLNIDTVVKWVRRQWGISRYKEDQFRSACKQFIKFIKGKEK